MPGGLDVLAPEGMLTQGLVWIAAADYGRDTLAWGEEILRQGCVCHQNQHLDWKLPAPHAPFSR